MKKTLLIAIVIIGFGCKNEDPRIELLRNYLQGSWRHIGIVKTTTL